MEHPQLACTRTDVSVEDDERSQRFSEADDVNSLQFLQEFWGRNARDASQRRPHDPFALAITSVWAKPSTGEITEVDIEFKGLGPRWGDLEADPEAGTDGSSHDLQNVLTHELGHVLGLDHTCDAGGQTNWTDHRGDPVGACPAPPETEGPTMVGSIQPGDWRAGLWKRTSNWRCAISILPRERPAARRSAKRRREAAPSARGPRGAAERFRS